MVVAAMMNAVVERVAPGFAIKKPKALKPAKNDQVVLVASALPRASSNAFSAGGVRYCNVCSTIPDEVAAEQLPPGSFHAAAVKETCAAGEHTCDSCGNAPALVVSPALTALMSISAPFTHLISDVDSVLRWHEQFDREMELHRRRLCAQGVLTPNQVAALTHVAGYSRSPARTAIVSRLLNRFTRLGFTASDLVLALRYFADAAPTVIHFRPQLILETLLRDGVYKNFFEIYSRQQREERYRRRFEVETHLFGTAYPESLDKRQRVKYGCMNFARKSTGVDRVAETFGDSYFTLKPDVLPRLTFACTDTYLDLNHISTCENYAYILDTYTDSELRWLMYTVLKLRSSRMASEPADLPTGTPLSSMPAPPQGPHCYANAMYKECHIHGLIDFHRDVEAVCLHVNNKSDKKIVSIANKMAEKFNCRIEWITGNEKF
jgi:hypothetical protein